MKKNYTSWELKISDFQNLKSEKDRVKFLINFALLAPSSHNSQPWAFLVEGEHIIRVYADFSRALHESDINNRQLYISLGCAITNILVAADYFGYTADVSTVPNSPERGLAAEITLTNIHKTIDSNHLIFSIIRRTNNRNKYDERQIPKKFIEEINNLKTENVDISVICDQQKRNELADVVLAAGETAMENGKFRTELAGYVKSNVTNSGTGMPGFGLGIPTLPSLLASTMVKYLNMNRLTHGKDEKILKIHTPSFVIISTIKDTPIEWLEAGQIYQRIALMATKEGLNTAIWAAAIQIESYYQSLQKIVNTNFRPQVFFRLGYTNKVPAHSPRLSLKDIMIVHGKH